MPTSSSQMTTSEILRAMREKRAERKPTPPKKKK
jgi:hypothetical protein